MNRIDFLSRRWSRPIPCWNCHERTVIRSVDTGRPSNQSCASCMILSIGEPPYPLRTTQVLVCVWQWRRREGQRRCSPARAGDAAYQRSSRIAPLLERLASEWLAHRRGGLRIVPSAQCPAGASSQAATSAAEFSRAKAVVSLQGARSRGHGFVSALGRRGGCRPTSGGPDRSAAP